MIQLLSKIFGRMPIGYLQLKHNKMRLFAAISGVAFANILVFVQLGILGAFSNIISLSYSPINAHVIVSASDTNTLSDGANVSRRYLYQSLSMPHVIQGTPIYIGVLQWPYKNGSNASMQVYGIPPEAMDFISPEFQARFHHLSHYNTALLDAKTRGLASAYIDTLVSEQQNIELNHQNIRIVGGFDIGGGFTGDGSIIVSDQTFMRLFPKRTAGTPSHILLKSDNTISNHALVTQLQHYLNTNDIKIDTLDERIDQDVKYQMTKRPVGVIFGFGAIIGMLVGVVITYQVLSTDVADHLKEYATFKAMGYSEGFLLSIINEQALVLAVFGFIPGSIIASFIYAGMSAATGLPVQMELSRMIIVFIGTLCACMVSGYIATRRLARADPADLF